MKRLSAFSTVLFSALLLACLGASLASASETPGFTADTFPASLEAPGAENGMLLTIGGTSIYCDRPSLSVSKFTAPSSSVTPTLGAANCHPFGHKVPLEMNGCQFIYKPGAETEPGVLGGSMEIGPPGCGSVSFSYYNEGSCKMQIFPGTLTATYKNEGSGSGASVAATPSGAALGWKLCSGAEHTSGAGIEATTWQLKAKNEAGGAIGLHAVPKLPTAIYMAGEQSAEEAKQPRFESEIYPVTIAGKAGAASYEKPTFVVKESEQGKAVCKESLFTSSMTALTKALSVEAGYSECESLSRKVNVHMNSCHYVFHALNSGVYPYTGSADIVCSKEGDGIEVIVYSTKVGEAEGSVLCSESFPAQTGLGTVSYVTTGGGYGRGIEVSSELTGMKFTYTRHSILCPLTSGTYENGKYTGTSDLFGSR